MSDQWNGKDRRNGGEDHDLLTEINTNLKAHLRNFDELVDDFKEHKKDDREQLDDLKRIGWLAVGAVVAIQTVFKFLFK